jgi:hypothetical protein
VDDLFRVLAGAVDLDDVPGRYVRTVLAHGTDTGANDVLIVR